MQKTDNRLMEARELRIGSVIAYCTHPVVVETIGKNTLGFTYLDKSISTNFEREINGINFKPIPITADTLEAAGFVKEDPKYGESWRVNDRFILRRVNYALGFKTPDYGYSFELSTEKDWAQVVDRVKYLHQLQNLTSALTGSELPITFKNKI